MFGSNLALRLGMAASVAVHLAVLATSLDYAGFLLVPSGSQRTIAVDLVTPQEVATIVRSAAPSIAKPTSETSQTTPKETSPEFRTTPEIQRPAARETAPQSIKPEFPDSQQSAVGSQPDLSIRYPMNLQAFGNEFGDFDEKATHAAQIDDRTIAAFRAQLRACSTLPSDIAFDDKIVIVIRVQFSPDGRLSTTPILIEASASPKGPLLMKAAMAALQACQPYTSLPQDKYREWKLLDLSFTPRDFRTT